MKLIDGQLPEGVEWRVLIALEPGQDPGVAWSIGSELAHSNRGDLVVGIIVPDDSKAILEQALNWAGAIRNRPREINNVDLFVLVVEDRSHEAALIELVKAAGIDLALVIATSPERIDYRNVPCAIAMLRLVPETNQIDAPEGQPTFHRILIPTSGGPNSAYALSLMMMLGPHTAITALYVASSARGDHEKALGHERLRQVLDFIHADDRVHSRLVVNDSVAAGIVEAAAGNYDLVVIGATEESRLDKIIFGNIPAAVVERSEIPVMVLRRNRSRISSAFTALDWRLHALIPQKEIGERAEIYARIRRGARPETPFFVLIALSAIIASLGLIVNSPAVVIGAMLVAPLMSPIIGTGLAMVLGDSRFLKLTLGAVNRGVLLAILVGFLVGLTAVNRPFSDEILARTQPNLYDLGIALFSGMAAAYALSFSQAAGALPGVAIAAALVPPLATVGITLSAGLVALITGRTGTGWSHLTNSLGALLLFTTNLIAISTAAAFVFFILGFRPTPSKKARREVQRRTSSLALASLLLVSVILGITSIFLARESATEGRIYNITDRQVDEFLGARLDAVDIIARHDGQLSLSLTVVSPSVIPHYQVVELQQNLAKEFVAEGIATDFALTMSVIRVTDLDPLFPPTPTPIP